MSPLYWKVASRESLDKTVVHEYLHLLRRRHSSLSIIRPQHVLNEQIDDTAGLSGVVFVPFQVDTH